MKIKCLNCLKSFDSLGKDNCSCDDDLKIHIAYDKDITINDNNTIKCNCNNSNIVSKSHTSTDKYIINSYACKCENVIVTIRYK